MTTFIQPHLANLAKSTPSTLLQELQSFTVWLKVVFPLKMKILKEHPLPKCIYQSTTHTHSMYYLFPQVVV